MRYAIISDIHSNLEALEAVIKACRDEGARTIICAGDVVGYGANPNECIELINKERIFCVAGNHDWAVCGKLNFDHFHEYAKRAVIWTQEQLSKENKEFLCHLELVFKNDDLIAVHSMLNHPQEFNYLNDPIKTSDTFYLMDRPVCFIGHTHIPQVFIRSNNRNDFLKAEDFHLDVGNKYIVNVGSVGQPRDSNPQATYAIYDPDLQRISIKRAGYDIPKTQQKMFLAGLPHMLAQRLMVGQ